MKHEMPTVQINFHGRRCDIKTLEIGERSMFTGWVDIGIRKE